MDVPEGCYQTWQAGQSPNEPRRFPAGKAIELFLVDFLANHVWWHQRVGHATIHCNDLMQIFVQSRTHAPNLAKSAIWLSYIVPVTVILWLVLKSPIWIAKAITWMPASFSLITHLQKGDIDWLCATLFVGLYHIVPAVPPSKPTVKSIFLVLCQRPRESIEDSKQDQLSCESSTQGKPTPSNKACQISASWQMISNMNINKTIVQRVPFSPRNWLNLDRTHHVFTWMLKWPPIKSTHRKSQVFGAFHPISVVEIPMLIFKSTRCLMGACHSVNKHEGKPTVS